MTDFHDADLYRLTYVSAARMAMSEADLDAILSVARDNNRQNHISGMLIYHEMQFFQTLEGTLKPLDRVFTSIRRDSRHSGCLMLERCAVARRLFDGWAMAYKSADELSAHQKQNFLELTKVRGQCAEIDAGGNADTLTLIDSFLSSFRYLKLA